MQNLVTDFGDLLLIYTQWSPLAWTRRPEAHNLAVGPTSLPCCRTGSPTTVQVAGVVGAVGLRSSVPMLKTGWQAGRAKSASSSDTPANHVAMQPVAVLFLAQPQAWRAVWLVGLFRTSWLLCRSPALDSPFSRIRALPLLTFYGGVGWGYSSTCKRADCVKSSNKYHYKLGLLYDVYK